MLPDAYQLYAIDPDDTRGNPNLQPEKSTALSLSVGGDLPVGSQRKLTWRLSSWERRVKNLIVDDDANPPAGFGSVFINVNEQVKVSGGELLLRAQLPANLTVDASYTYSQERTQDSTQQLANRPLHSGKLGLSWAPSSRYGADFAVKYFGSTYSNVAGFGQQPYGGDYVTNLGVHLFADQAQHHRFGLRVENLFDTRYATRVNSAVLAGSVPATRLRYHSLGAPRTAFLNYAYSF
jgi:vitamin B12 transporter